MSDIRYRAVTDLIADPNNARTHSPEQIAKIEASIERFGFTNPALVDAADVIRAGNGRHAAAVNIYARGGTIKSPNGEALLPGMIPTIDCTGWTDAECRAYALADNKIALDAGWDDDRLAAELAALGEMDFDLDLTGFSESERAALAALGDSDQSGDQPSKIPHDALETSWRRWALELAAQVRACGDSGFPRQGVTPGFALNKFLAALHDGDEYPRYALSAFHPDIYGIAGAKASILDGLDRIAAGDLDFRRLEFVCGGTMNPDRVLGSPLPFGASRLPADFPASLARNLIDEFAPNGSVVDPCHGWGGRLIGFMLSSANSYAATDPAPSTHRGVTAIRDLFMPYAHGDKSADLFNLPAEKWTPPAAGYDLALTSPPYFDTEKYEGGDQSRLAHSDYASWRDGFYTTLIERVHSWLRPGGVFALQVGSQIYPLASDGGKIAKATGFALEATRATDMVNNFTGTEAMDGEVVMILRKPA